MRKQRNWERQVAAKKSKRKEEKQRRKLNREESGKDRVKSEETFHSRLSITRTRLCWVFVMQVLVLAALSLPNGS